MLKDLLCYVFRFFRRHRNILLLTGDAYFVELMEGLKVNGIEVYLGRPHNCFTKLQLAVKLDQQLMLSELTEFSKYLEVV